jgi:hypothetical protein
MPGVVEHHTLRALRWAARKVKIEMLENNFMVHGDQSPRGKGVTDIRAYHHRLATCEFPLL